MKRILSLLLPLLLFIGCEEKESNDSLRLDDVMMGTMYSWTESTLYNLDTEETTALGADKAHLTHGSFAVADEFFYINFGDKDDVELMVEDYAIIDNTESSMALQGATKTGRDITLTLFDNNEGNVIICFKVSKTDRVVYCAEIE